MDFIWATMQYVFLSILQYPIYSVAVSLFFTGCLIKFYSRITLGVWDLEQDMSGKTVLITGATSGIGKVTALDLARRNARVLLACRDTERALKVSKEIKTLTGNQNIFVISLDLSSFDSVRKCAKNVLETEDKLHVLVNNAGLMSGRNVLTKDGCNLVMQTNHFGHFLLTLLLLDLIRKSSPSRIINVSSLAHKYNRLDLNDLNNKKRSVYIYGNSKLANVMFTRELADRLRGTGVTVNSLHPGVVTTNLLIRKEVGTVGFVATKILYFLTGKTPEEGAQTTIRLAVDPTLDNTTGKYFADCKEMDVAKEAKDTNNCKRLFELSEQIVGENFQ